MNVELTIGNYFYIFIFIIQFLFIYIFFIYIVYNATFTFLRDIKPNLNFSKIKEDFFILYRMNIFNCLNCINININQLIALIYTLIYTFTVLIPSLVFLTENLNFYLEEYLELISLFCTNSPLYQGIKYVYNLPSFYYEGFINTVLGCGCIVLVWAKLSEPDIWKLKYFILIASGKRLAVFYTIVGFIVFILYLFNSLNTTLFGMELFHIALGTRLLFISFTILYGIRLAFFKENKDKFKLFIFRLSLIILSIFLLKYFFNNFLIDIIFIKSGLVLINDGDPSSSNSNNSGENNSDGDLFKKPQPPKRPDYTSILWKKPEKGSSSKSDILENNTEDSKNNNKRTVEEAGLTNNSEEAKNSRTWATEGTNVRIGETNVAYNPGDYKKHYHPVSSNGNKYMTVLQIVEDKCVKRILDIQVELVGIKQDIAAMQELIDRAGPGALVMSESINNAQGLFTSMISRTSQPSSHHSPFSSFSSSFGGPSSYIGHYAGNSYNRPPSPPFAREPKSTPSFNLIPFRTPRQPGDPIWIAEDGGKNFDPNTLIGIYNAKENRTIQEELRIKYSERVRLEREFKELKYMSKKIRVAGPLGIYKVSYNLEDHKNYGKGKGPEL